MVKETVEWYRKLYCCMHLRRLEGFVKGNTRNILRTTDPSSILSFNTFKTFWNTFGRLKGNIPSFLWNISTVKLLQKFVPYFLLNCKYIVLYCYSYNLVFLSVTYLIPMTIMAICYTFMGCKLWGSKSIGELTYYQKKSMKSKRKVRKILILKWKEIKVQFSALEKLIPLLEIFSLQQFYQFLRYWNNFQYWKFCHRI